MASGAAAAAAGMDVVPATADINMGYDEINKSRDYLAAHETAGGHPASTVITSGQLAIAQGGTGAATAAAARTALSVPEAAATAAAIAAATLPFTPVEQSGGSGMASNKIRIGWSGAELLAQVDAVPMGGLRFKSDGNFGPSVPIYTPHGRANPAVSSYVVAYLNGDGRVAGGASSRRFKKEIHSWTPDLQAVLALQLVTFRYKAAVYGNGDAPVEVGLIAEELVDLGLSWLVFYDDAGQPQGIHYERIALALLPVVQDHEARIAALEERLS